MKTGGQEKFNRYEFKYILNPAKALAIREYLNNLGLKRDPHAGEKGSYVVTSIYYENNAYSDYYDKLGGLHKRKKVRVRFYGDTLNEENKKVNLEIKNKEDMFVAKDRKRVQLTKWVDGSEDNKVNEFSIPVLSEGRVPRVLVKYDREVFLEDFLSHVRVTLDSNIRAAEITNIDLEGSIACDTIPVSKSGTIMEVKFSGRMPWWFGLMTRKFNLTRTSYSKYAHSIDAITMYKPLPR